MSSSIDNRRPRARAGRGLALWLASVATLAVALTVAPIALAGATLWFALRFVSYATARVVEADIIDWYHDRHADHPTASVAYPKVHFTDHTGRERIVTSSVGTPTDLAISAHDPLPEGPLRMRYRTWPFLALEDNPAVWLAGPAILLAMAVLGTMLKVLFRFQPLAWVMGT